MANNYFGVNVSQFGIEPTASTSYTLRGTWNPTSELYPENFSANSMWFVDLPNGINEYIFDGTTWVEGDFLVYDHYNALYSCIHRNDQFYGNNVLKYGAIGDGTIHTVQEWIDSGRYSSLIQIQSDYPFVTSLTQSIDWAAIQKAIFTGRHVYIPKGDYWISNELEQITPGQVIEFEGTGGYGYGSFTKLRSNWVKHTRWTAYGTGFTSDARVRTRCNHRASSADPQDNPLSVVLNIQAEGVQLIRPHIWLNCDYSDNRPSNLGDACDIGIFIGCRVGVKIVDPQVIGYFRLSGIHYDVTHDTELPRHLDKTGIPYPIGQNVGGADGCSLYNPFILGARRGLAISGSKPANGYTWYGPAYYDEQLGTTVSDSRGNFGFSDFIVHEGRVFGPEHHSGYRLEDPVGYGTTLTEMTMKQEPENAPCAMYISGLAGNSNHVVHGMRFYGTRFSSWEMFRVRLDYAARQMFNGCHIEGSGASVKDSHGNAILVGDWWYGHIAGSSSSKKLQVHGGITTTGYEFAFNWYFGEDFTWYNERGDAYVRSLNGVQDYVDIFLSKDRTLVAKFTQNSLSFPTGISLISTQEELDLRGDVGYGVRFRTGASTIATITSDNGLAFYGGTGKISTDDVELDLRGGDSNGVRIRSGSTTLSTVLSTGITSYGVGTIIKPSSDNTVPYGSGAARGTTIYLGTAPNVTSDERHKTDIKPIDEAALDAWGNVEYYQYSLIDGTSNRKHTGAIVQKILKIFEDAGLDATEYGLCCHESWEAKEATYETISAVYDEEGNIIEPEHEQLLDPAVEAGDIWTLRYDEVYAFEAAYQRRLNKKQAEIINSLLERITALENK